MKRRWTEDEIKFLIENYPKYNSYYIAKALNRSVNSVRCMAAKLKLKNKFWWTEEEKKFLIENYDKMTAKQISEILGRSIPSIYSMAKKLSRKGLISKKVNMPKYIRL